MKVVNIKKLTGTDRDVHCPNGGFRSVRGLLASDGMGFSVHKTIIPPGGAQHWHYKHHYEACYCIDGVGVLTNLATMEEHTITPDVMYVLDQHDDHTFRAITPVVLISIFNPPCTGHEVHGPDGSYSPAEGE